MEMRHSLGRPISLVVLAALIAAVLTAAPDYFVRVAVAASRTLSDVQLKKINGWIADKGNDVVISAVITDILGLTENDQTISSRAFAAVDGENSEIHQVYLLPQGKGYLEDHFHQDKVEVYWTDKDFVLIAALTGARGEKPGATSFPEAQYGFSKEVAWWAKFADTH